jgi:hypothetical protein
MATERTDRSKYHYKVKEYVDGLPRIMGEPLEGPDLLIPGQWFLGFDLAAQSFGHTGPASRSLDR